MLSPCLTKPKHLDCIHSKARFSKGVGARENADEGMRENAAQEQAARLHKPQMLMQTCSARLHDNEALLPLQA